MNKIFNKAYLYFWVSIPLLITYGVLNQEGTFIVDFYDVYFVIANPYLVLVTSIAFAIMGFWYWLMRRMKRELILWMTIIHVVVTIDGILLAFLIEQFFRKPHLEMEYTNVIALIFNIILVLVFLVQIVFPLNIIVTLLKRPNNVVKGP